MQSYPSFKGYKKLIYTDLWLCTLYFLEDLGLSKPVCKDYPPPTENKLVQGINCFWFVIGYQRCSSKALLSNNREYQYSLNRLEPAKFRARNASPRFRFAKSAIYQCRPTHILGGASLWRREECFRRSAAAPQAPPGRGRPGPWVGPASSPGT